MVHKAARLALALLVLAWAGCGDGSDGGAGSKAEFDAYAARVDPLLAAEKRLRQMFKADWEAAGSLDRFAELAGRTRSTYIPEFEKLARQADEIRPESGRLRELHSRFRTCLTGRLACFRMFLEWAEKAGPPADEMNRALKAERGARELLQERLMRIDDLVRARPELGEMMGRLMKDDPVAALGFLRYVAGYLSDQVGVDDVRNAIAKVSRYCDELEERLDETAATEETREVLEATRGYLTALRAHLVALGAFVDTNQRLSPFVNRELRPLLEGHENGMVQGDKDIEAYRNAAMSYRSSR